MFSVDLGNLSFDLSAVVAELSLDGLLGLDFLEDHECAVDVTKRTLRIKHQQYSLLKEGFFGCFKIVASDTLIVPANQKILIKGRVCVSDGQHVVLCDCLVEPSEKFVSSGTLVGRTLVRWIDVILMRVMNIDAEDITM